MGIFLLIFGLMCVLTGGFVVGLCTYKIKDTVYFLGIPWGFALVVGGQLIWTNASVIAKAIG